MKINKSTRPEVFYKKGILNGNADFIFLCNPQKSSVNACFMKILKSTVTKKVIVCFYKLLKVAAFVIIPTSIMALHNYAFPLKI